MVRLVFRPYTQFRRSICTSESLRTSIRVSPDFVLTRHSSPSFGSQRVRSWCASSCNKNETPRECEAIAETIAHPPLVRARRTFTFIAPLGLVMSQWLAHMLDSLVRVSRRVLKVPKAIASQIGVSTRSVRELCSEQPFGNRTGTRSDHHYDKRACHTSNANYVAALRHIYTVERADRETPRVRSR